MINEQLILFESSKNQIKLEVKFDKESFWLSLNQMEELFERDKSVISRHLKHIYLSNELEIKATVAKNTTVQYRGQIEFKPIFYSKIYGISI